MVLGVRRGVGNEVLGCCGGGVFICVLVAHQIRSFLLYPLLYCVLIDIKGHNVSFSVFSPSSDMVVCHLSHKRFAILDDGDVSCPAPPSSYGSCVCRLHAPDHRCGLGRCTYCWHTPNIAPSILAKSANMVQVEDHLEASRQTPSHRQVTIKMNDLKHMRSTQSHKPSCICTSISLIPYNDSSIVAYLHLEKWQGTCV